jgi:dipeptidyl-peptidase-4
MKWFLTLTLLLPTTLTARDVERELQRAEQFGRDASSLVHGGQPRLHWSPESSRLVWRTDQPGEGIRFSMVRLDTGEVAPAFDHAVVARLLAEAAGREVAADKLPLEDLVFAGEPESLHFRAFGSSWKLVDDQLLPAAELPAAPTTLIAPEAAPRGTRRNGEATRLTIENATAGEIEMFWVDGGGQRRSYGRLAAGDSTTQNTYAGHLWLMTDADGTALAAIETPAAPAVARVTGKVEPPRRRPAANRRGGGGGGGDTSPDGKWQAFIRDHNVFIRPLEGDGEPVRLSDDGTPAKRYGGPLVWSPDSRKLVAMHTPQVEVRRIHIVESSPADQLQPKLRTLDYNKPGDPIQQNKPRLFHVDEPRQIELDDALFDNPWSIRDLAWAPDSSEFSFSYNQRGHQVMRIVGIRADSGSPRVIHEEKTDTFIDYSQKYFMRRLGDSRQFLWASEGSGYNHLYLVDEASGTIANPVTSGDWNVREVIEVDEENRSLLLRVVGLSGSDPYHSHFIRVNFDGTGVTRLTESDGDHRIEFSPDRQFLVATWSRADHPPVTELRRASDGSLVAELDRADDSALRATGWSRPERFVAKGRDGQTDIHGVIIKPRNFDPNKRYPVVEDIYAGPHDHFVNKSFRPWYGMNNIAELGFIVVKIDGMGTNWRSKAFHDVAWKNLKDSGFPDRIPWIQAAAATRPWMDLTRVGIFGGSAGGQSTLSGLLHHGDFYKVGVADCGCHDNRMDKVWWNEAWMGWPVDDSYADNSNTTHAAKLQGKLMLVVGELDDNVDPASTAQVVHALQKANKIFDFVPIINAGHGAAESPYGKMRRANFLVTHLQADPD